jgi:hypothetical protein
MRRFETPGVVLLLALALVVLAPAFAADEPAKAEPAKDESKADDASKDAAVEGEIIFGPQYFADTDNRDSKKFEEYRDVPNGFVVEWFDFHWRPADRMFFDLSVRDVTQRDQKILFQVGRQDLWRGTVHWSENPREWTDQAYQLFPQSSLGKFTLEDSFQAAARGAGERRRGRGWRVGPPAPRVSSSRTVSPRAPSPSRSATRGRWAGGVRFTPGRNWISRSRETASGRGPPQTLGMYAQAPRGRS